MRTQTIQLNIEKESTKRNDNRTLELLRLKFFPPGVKLLSKGINLLHTVSPKFAFSLTMRCFSIAIRRKLSTKDRAFYKKGMAKEWTIGRTVFKTYQYGSGPKILLVHGWASNGARWINYVEDIVNKGFTAVVIDAPGHGNSPGRSCAVPTYIDSVKKVLKSGTQWHSVISHSIGSIVASVALEESGIQLTSNKLVIMSTFSDCDGLLTRFGRCIGFSNSLMRGTKQWITKWSGKPLHSFSLIRSIQRLNLDLLLIHDQQDIVVPSCEIYQIERSLKNLKSIKTTGHGHNLRHPKFCKWSIDFVTKSKK